MNLSVKQFQDSELIAKVERAISRHDLRPGSLVLELTEGLLAEDTAEFTSKLRELRALGVRIAIDDFGTGYSSLGYLQRLPIDVLKIDKSFVEGIDRGPQESALARAIIKVADTMNLHIVAEGVEREPQRAELMRLGCRFAQGFLFSEPLDESAVEIMLLSRTSNPDAQRLTLPN